MGTPPLAGDGRAPYWRVQYVEPGSLVRIQAQCDLWCIETRKRIAVGPFPHIQHLTGLISPNCIQRFHAPTRGYAQVLRIPREMKTTREGRWMSGLN